MEETATKVGSGVHYVFHMTVQDKSCYRTRFAACVWIWRQLLAEFWSASSLVS
jgi:hypothetical protein